MQELEQICEQIRQCERCRLAEGRTHAVPGAGPADADLMFIGEAPGFHEDRQGLPFVGAAGEFLNELLASIGLARDDVYITNVIKCRPPGNRDPQADEIETCRPYLDEQIEIIEPKMIVTLGRFSMQLAFSDVTITRVHGTPKRVGDVLYFPMFHPAAALHQPRYRPLIEEDIKKIPEILDDVESFTLEEEPSDKPKQLGLF